MSQEAGWNGFELREARSESDSISSAIESMQAVAEVEIASALEYAHARAAALIAEAEAEAESIRAAARIGAPPLALIPAPEAAPSRPAAATANSWAIPVEALLPMIALVLVLVVALAWIG